MNPWHKAISSFSNEERPLSFDIYRSSNQIGNYLYKSGSMHPVMKLAKLRKLLVSHPWLKLKSHVLDLSHFSVLESMLLLRLLLVLNCFPTLISLQIFSAV